MDPGFPKLVRSITDPSLAVGKLFCSCRSPDCTGDIRKSEKCSYKHSSGDAGASVLHAMQQVEANDASNSDIVTEYTTLLPLES